MYLIKITYYFIIINDHLIIVDIIYIYIYIYIYIFIHSFINFRGKCAFLNVSRWLLGCWNIDLKLLTVQGLKSSLPSMYGILVPQYNFGSSLGFYYQ